MAAAEEAAEASARSSRGEGAASEEEQARRDELRVLVASIDTDGDGLVSVTAGPGSGKTRVIVARIVHLLQVQQVPASRLLGLTFSNKAAAEMAQRVRGAPYVVARQRSRRRRSQEQRI